jgi:hypothetical protein
MFDLHPNTDRRWLLGWIAAFGLLVTTTLAHQARLRHVESIPVWSVTPAVADSTSPTGYTDGRRQWISPTREQETYGWIARTQHLFATGELRRGRIDWDNAPEGRADHAPTLYTLWIAGTAWLVHAVSEGSLALAAERAALWADPAVALGFLLFAGGWMWRAFSARAACVLALGWVLLQPLASAYLPGALDPRGLAWALLAGSLRGRPRDHAPGGGLPPRRRRRSPRRAGRRDRSGDRPPGHPCHRFGRGRPTSLEHRRIIAREHRLPVALALVVSGRRLGHAAGRDRAIARLESARRSDDATRTGDRCDMARAGRRTGPVVPSTARNSVGHGESQGGLGHGGWRGWISRGGTDLALR